MNLTIKTKTISILGKKYTINFVPPSLITENYGHADYSSLSIALSEVMEEDLMQEKLIHEVLHMIDTDLSLDLTEEQVSRIAVGLYSTGRIKLI